MVSGDQTGWGACTFANGNIIICTFDAIIINQILNCMHHTMLSSFYSASRTFSAGSSTLGFLRSLGLSFASRAGTFDCLRPSKTLRAFSLMSLCTFFSPLRINSSAEFPSSACSPKYRIVYKLSPALRIKPFVLLIRSLLLGLAGTFLLPPLTFIKFFVSRFTIVSDCAQFH